MFPLSTRPQREASTRTASFDFACASLPCSSWEVPWRWWSSSRRSYRRSLRSSASCEEEKEKCARDTARGLHSIFLLLPSFLGFFCCVGGEALFLLEASRAVWLSAGSPFWWARASVLKPANMPILFPAKSTRQRDDTPTERP